MDDQAQQRHVRHEMVNCVHALNLIVEAMPHLGAATRELLEALDDIDHEADRLIQLLDEHHLTENGEEPVLVH